MRILLGHTFPNLGPRGSWTNDWLIRLRTAGFDVHPFSLIFDQNRPVWYFDELNRLWRYRDKSLMTMYRVLQDTLVDYDVFICFNGANVHPDFVSGLQCTTVYACFDDPESSLKLSKPVVNAFDIAMVGNIAEVHTYRKWGVRNVNWWPLGFRSEDYESELTDKEILYGHRDMDITLLCERETRYRKKRVDQFVSAFPNGSYYGKGWPTGFLPENMRVPLLQRTKIGINIHNSTGPINFRTFYLPANGVMQICDNKSFLNGVFKLGLEIVGYDSIQEAIELTHHYLVHEEERKQIAVAGWRRTLLDYNEVACFQRVVDAVTIHQANSTKGIIKNFMPPNIETRAAETILNRLINNCILSYFEMRRRVRSLAVAIIKSMLRRIN